jgi:hypothetical protein
MKNSMFIEWSSFVRCQAKFSDHFYELQFSLWQLKIKIYETHYAWPSFAFQIELFKRPTKLLASDSDFNPILKFYYDFGVCMSVCVGGGGIHLLIVA